VQGGATAIASSFFYDRAEYDGDDDENGNHDPWLRQYYITKSKEVTLTAAVATETEASNDRLPFPLLFDVRMLERYILLCAQEIQGGLRDKPSKPRDFYHTCYNLSGLSVLQHYGDVDDESYGDPVQTKLQPTHPCYNIRIDRVAKILSTKWE
jgi:hypothetical protein